MSYLYEDIKAADRNDNDYDGFNAEGDEDGEEPFFDEDDDDLEENEELDEEEGE